MSGWLLLAGIAFGQVPNEAPSAEAARFRRPVALALADDDRRLYVANRESGTVSVVDAVERRVIGELQVGQRLADLAAWGGDCLLAVDVAAHELIVLQRVPGAAPGLTVHARTPVSSYPVSIVVSEDGRTAYVASLWSRRVSIVELSADAESTGATGVRVARTIDLPFAPREQLLVRGGATLIVADSFGGKLALIDTAGGRLVCVRELPAHNIRGLALDPTGQKLLVSHQILNSLAETTHNDVHWGILLINVLRWLSLDRVLDPEAAILGDSHVHPAGDSDGAGGDPAGLAVTADGTVLLALAGMGRMAMGRETDYALRGVAVGQRPTDVVAAANGRWACVANTLADSLTFIDDVETGEASPEMPLGTMPALGPFERGELLFHDARLSLDGWFSCHSCHTDGHANGLLVDNLGDGSFGAAKRVLSLLGTGQTGPWAWNGGVADLGAQVHKSIESTMQGTPPTDEQTADMVAYLNSLQPPPPLAIARAADEADWKPAFERGAAVFAKQGCAACHDPESNFTTPAAYDVGLSATPGERFNPPSLRGVSQGGPYLHDNRAASLRDLFTKHRHQVSTELSADDLADLLSYLEGL